MAKDMAVKALAQLREYLEIDLTRAVRWLSDPPSFSIWVGDKQIDLGEVESLISQRRFRAIIYRTTGKMPRRIHEKDWDTLLDSFGTAWEDVEVAVTTELEVLQLWVSEYLENNQPLSMIEGQNRWKEQLIIQKPVMTSAGVFINAVSLQSFVAGKFHEQLTHTGISVKLKRYGCDKETFKWKGNGGTFSRHYWRMTQELTPEWISVILPLEGSVDL